MSNIPKAGSRPSYMKAVDEQLRTRQAEAEAASSSGGVQPGDGVEGPSAEGPRFDPLLFGVRAVVTLLTPAEGANTNRLFKAIGDVARLVGAVADHKAPPEDRAAAAAECLKTVRELTSRMVDAVTGSMVVDGAPAKDAPATVPVTPAGTTSLGYVEVSLRDMYGAQRADGKTNAWHAGRLLTEYYRAFEATFVDKSEIEPQAVLRSYLTDPETNWDITVLLDPSGKVIGGAHHQVMDTGEPPEGMGQVGVIEHIWIDRAARNSAQGRELVEAVVEKMRAQGAEGVFIEVNDPQSPHWSAEARAADLAGAGIDGYERLSFWDRMGFGELDGLRYIQMPLEAWKAGEEAEGQVPYLMPLYRSLGPDGAGFSRDQVLKMVEAYFDSFDSASSLPPGVESVRQTETFQEIERDTQEQVGLRRLTDDPRYAPGIEDARHRLADKRGAAAT